MLMTYSQSFNASKNILYVKYSEKQGKGLKPYNSYYNQQNKTRAQSWNPAP